ncbi:MAG: hypothetical protein JEZ11_18210 [Desulfobacterales bacterium]|nr:hypothetical protein [Desulfobacterales bacterium]
MKEVSRFIGMGTNNIAELEAILVGIDQVENRRQRWILDACMKLHGKFRSRSNWLCRRNRWMRDARCWMRVLGWG